MTGELTTECYGRSHVLFGPRAGRYPDGNSLVVNGTDTRVLIDPSLGVRAHKERGACKLLDNLDRVLLSHCHEDHIAGLDLFPETPVSVHEADLVGLRSLDEMLAIYGAPGSFGADFPQSLVRDFHYVPRPDASPFDDGFELELGGVSVRAVHTPGHTRGHCCFTIEDADGEGPILYLGDIDLSGFGPYYGDAWSDLEDFERSIDRVREIDARWYATFHHIGVIERTAFLERLDRFAAMIRSREERMLAFLGEPRDLAAIVAHRFVYRPDTAPAFADAVERRSMSQHLDRLEVGGRVEQVDGTRYRAV